MTSEQALIERPTRVPFWRLPFDIIRHNMRAYLILSAAAYGLPLIGFAIGLVFPDLTAARAASLEDDGTGELVRGLVNTPPLFALTILGVNVFRLSLLTIVLPSPIVPFAGFAFFGYWAVETGITLVPTTSPAWVTLIPHALTFVIELQAYVLLLLGVYLLGRYWLFPRPVGAENRRRGLSQGPAADRGVGAAGTRPAHRRRRVGGVLSALRRVSAQSATPVIPHSSHGRRPSKTICSAASVGTGLNAAPQRSGHESDREDTSLAEYADRPYLR